MKGSAVLDYRLLCCLVIASFAIQLYLNFHAAQDITARDQSLTNCSIVSWTALVFTAFIVVLRLRSHRAETYRESLGKFLDQLLPQGPGVDVADRQVPSEEMLYRMGHHLREAVARETAIAEYSKELICTLTQEYRIASVNQTWLRLLGYLPEETIQEHLSSFVADLDLSAFQSQLEAARRDNSTARFHLRLAAKHGNVLDFQWEAEWSDRERQYFAVATDVTAEMTVKRSREEVLGMFSHDVRLPLTSISFGLTSVSDGLHGEVSESARQALVRAERNVSRVIDLFTELIDLDKSAEGKLVLDLEIFELADLINSALEQVSDLASKVEVKFEVDAPDVLLKGDPRRLLRVLINLISNAVKYSPRGGEVVLRVIEREREFEFQVADQGPGIPEHLRKIVFQRYVQLERAPLAVPSSGLGLAICKAFVEAHGGLIGVESQAKAGSTFWFTIPRQ